MAASLAHEKHEEEIQSESEDEEPKAVSPAAPTSSAQSAATPAPASLPSILSDRAQLERERLARQQAKAGGPSSSAHAKTAGSSTNATPTSSSAPTGTSSRIATFSELAKRDEETAAGPSTSRITAQPRPINVASSSGSTSSRPPSHHPLQSRGPFPTDAAGEYFLDGELRHTTLSIGQRDSRPTFSPQDVVGKVS